MPSSVYEVVPVENLRPDPLNPRERINERAAALDLSLTRFGHVLPIVADLDGTVASGHQRLPTSCRPRQT